MALVFIDKKAYGVYCLLLLPQESCKGRVNDVSWVQEDLFLKTQNCVPAYVSTRRLKRHARNAWGHLNYDLSSPEEIDAMTQKILPYGMLWNVYHRINRISKDSDMLSTMAAQLLRDVLLPAIEQTQPLNF